MLTAKHVSIAIGVLRRKATNNFKNGCLPIISKQTLIYGLCLFSSNLNDIHLYIFSQLHTSPFVLL